ncbi:MAG: hypothetical protein ACOH1T_07870 [Microbacteriaceae bacterium]
MRIDDLTSENLGTLDRWRLVVVLHAFGMIGDDSLPAEGARMLAAGEVHPAILELAILYSSTSNLEIREAFDAACVALHTHPAAGGSAVSVAYRVACQAALDRGDEGVFALPDPSDWDDAEWQLYRAEWQLFYELSELSDLAERFGDDEHGYVGPTGDGRTDIAAAAQAYLARTIGTPLTDQLRWAMKL